MSPYLYMFDVSYNTDFEYRQCIRNVFCMIPKENSDDDEIDDITRDENNYDEDNAQKALDYVYDNTSKHPLFMKLYEKAAGHMLSLDKTIGLSVLCSYDYLHLFHKCIHCFMTEPETFSETHPYYTKMNNAL
jgi:hypothetical protein